MKHTCFLVLLVAFFNAGAQRVTMNIQTGLSLSNDVVVAKNSVTASRPTVFKSGFYAGLVVQVAVSSHWSIVSGFLYSKKGYHEPSDKVAGVFSPDSDLASNLSYSFIDVPVLAQLKLSKNTCIRLGPQASFLLPGKQGSAGKGLFSLFGIGSPQIVLGLAAGACVPVSKQVSLNIHYSMDLQAHAEDAGAGHYLPVNGLHNQTLRVWVMYRLRHK